MTKVYKTVEGEATALDTKSQLMTRGQDGIVTPVLVPASVSQLEAIIVAVAGNMAIAGSCGVLVRLEGGGLVDGNETYAVGACGGNSTTGIQQRMQPRLVPVGKKVVPGNEIQVFLEMVGADIGQVSGGVTLVFS